MKIRNTLIGRMTPAERALGRFMRSPDGHPDAAPAAEADAPVDAAAEAGADAGAGADGDASAGSPAGTAPTDVASEDAADWGDGAADKPATEGATDEADAASEDGADAEVAPYEGLTPPEGFEALDTEALAAAAPLMREFGVPDDKAQDFINRAAPVISGMVEKALTQAAEAQETARIELSRQWAEETKADPEVGGAKYDESRALAAKARDAFFGDLPEFREFLTTTQLTNHPAMLKGFARIGRQISDGSIHIGDSTAKEDVPLAHKLYPAYVPKD